MTNTIELCKTTAIPAFSTVGALAEESDRICTGEAGPRDIIPNSLHNHIFHFYIKASHPVLEVQSSG